MSVFDYTFQTKILDFGLTGTDSYAPDSSLASALKPRPLISNEREHANVVRVDRIEHDLVKDRLQEEADRGVLKSDIGMFTSSLKSVVDFENHTEFVLSNLNSSLSRAEQSRVKDENFLMSSINENIDKINDIIVNQNALTAAEKADLILEQVINSSRAVAHTSAAIADGAGVIPIFGPNVASGARVVSDTAEAIADTAAAVKASQISQQLSTAFSALRTVHEHPNKFIEPALNTIKTGHDLVPKLKLIVDRARRANELTFARVTVPGSIAQSVAYISVHSDFETSIIYHIRPSTGTYGIKAAIGSRRINYTLHTFYGELDPYGFGPTVMSSGTVPTPPSTARLSKFNTVINADRCRSMLIAMQSIALSLTDEEYVGYFEQYLCRAIEPDNDTLLRALHSAFDIVHSDMVSSDLHDDHVTMLADLDAKRADFRNHLNETMPGTSNILVPTNHESRVDSTHAINLRSTARIGEFRVFDYYVGPFTHSGKFVIGLVIDSLYVEGYSDNRKFVVVQYAGDTGQRITIINNQPESQMKFEMTVTVNAQLNLDQTGGDRAVVRIYGLGLCSVRVITGPYTGSVIALQPPKSVEEHKTRNFDYSFMRRHLDPKLLNVSKDVGLHEWSEYSGTGNWTNVL